MTNYDDDFDYDDIPWDEIPNGNYLPSSIVLAELEMLSDEFANSGKRMFVANFKIMEPSEFYGRRHTERYVVSTDTHPQKFDATTLGAIGLKQMRMAAQIKPMKASELCEYAATVRPQLMFQLKEPKPTDDFQNNAIVKYFAIGEREPEILTNTISKKGNKPLAQKAPMPQQQPQQHARQQPRQQPQTQQEHQPRISEPAHTRQQAPAERPYQNPQQMSPEPNPEDLVPFDVYDDSDEVSYDTQAQTASGTKTDTRPKTQADMPAETISNPHDILITCPKCNQGVPSSQMGQHMADHFRS
jgi:hypothetical protein